MRPKSISYQQLFPTGAFSNVRLGMEVELNEVDSPEAAYQYAKETIDKWHRATNPQLYIDMPEGEMRRYDTGITEYADEQTPTVTIKKDSKKEATSRMIEAISGSSDMVVLEQFRKLAKSQGGEVLVAFNNREKQLQSL